MSSAPSAGAGARQPQPNAVGYAAAVRRMAARVRSPGAELDAAALTALAELLADGAVLCDVCDADGPDGLWPTDALIDAVQLLRKLAAGYHPTPEPEPQG